MIWPYRLRDNVLVIANIASLLLLLVGLIGCTGRAPLAAPGASAAGTAPQLYQLHLPGIGGDNFIERWWCGEIERSLSDPPNKGSAHSERMTARCDLWDWTPPGRLLIALSSYDHNRAQGRAVAEHLAEWRRKNPDTRIVLTAASGGAGPAVWALEALPDDVKIDEVILVAPALSPDYDLSTALSHVGGRMHVFISDGDRFILGWGTRNFGTIDRKFVDSAGLLGFTAPPDGAQRPGEYTKLEQISYRKEWRKHLNFGGHAEALSPLFGARVIAPLVRTGSFSPG